MLALLDRQLIRHLELQNPPDLSTKLKLMGVDVSETQFIGRNITDVAAQVASFGDFFAEKHAQTVSGPSTASPPSMGKETTSSSVKLDASTPRKRHGAAAAAEGPVEALTYRDPFAGVYKKYDLSNSLRLRIGLTHMRNSGTSLVPTANISWGG